MINLKDLKAADEASKPAGATADWLVQGAMYDDAGRAWSRTILEKLKVGLKDNDHPIQVMMLRRVVDRLAALYDQAPMRWLLNASGKRYAEDGPQHRAMLRVLGPRYNAAWRAVDRRRALHRNVVMRFYASDHRKQVVLRTFEPFSVLRMPDAGEADIMDADQAFALNIGTPSAPQWETWERQGEAWSCLVLDDEGKVVGRPFAPSDDVCPYPVLPVQIVHDEWSDGRAWIPPRSSRTTWLAALNAVANDLWSMAVNQAHTEVWAEAQDERDVPDETGHGLRPVLVGGAKLHALHMQPKIAEVLDMTKLFARLWLSGEDLPTDEFEDSRQVVTGAALKVREAPLMARREAQVEQAPEDEASAWRRLRAVHDVHAARWEVDPAPAGELEVEIADVNPPEDADKLQQRGLRGMAAGTMSLIDAIQAERGCSRAQAILHAERVKSDNERFPPGANVGQLVEGPKPASVEHQSPNAGGSVVQAIQASGQQATEPQGLPAE